MLIVVTIVAESVELCSACALPSLLLSTLSPEPPSLIVVTDYPDEGIMGNLKGSGESLQRITMLWQKVAQFNHMGTSGEPMDAKGTP